jgi:hypothetical protein
LLQHFGYGVDSLVEVAVGLLEQKQVRANLLGLVGELKKVWVLDGHQVRAVKGDQFELSLVSPEELVDGPYLLHLEALLYLAVVFIYKTFEGFSYLTRLIASNQTPATISDEEATTDGLRLVGKLGHTVGGQIVMTDWLTIIHYFWHLMTL